MLSINRPLGQRGTTLVETLVSLGVSGIVLLIVLAITDNFSTQLGHVERKMEALSLQQALLTATLDPEFCRCNFGGGDSNRHPVRLLASNPQSSVEVSEIKRYASGCKPMESFAVAGKPLTLGNGRSPSTARIELANVALSENTVLADLRVTFAANRGGEIGLRPVIIPGLAFTTAPEGTNLRIVSCGVNVSSRAPAQACENVKIVPVGFKGSIREFCGGYPARAGKRCPQAPSPGSIIALDTSYSRHPLQSCDEPADSTKVMWQEIHCKCN